MAVKDKRLLKTKHILINLLPLPIWLVYYCLTMSKNNLFLVSKDDWVLLGIFSIFTIYNFFSQRIKEFLIRNMVLTASLATGIYLGGQIYLKFCSHMSDEHYAVIAIMIDIFICGIIVTAVFCLIRFIVSKMRKKEEH